MKKISIIIPAHNEEKRIGKTLRAYLDYFGKLKKDKKIDFEIIVVLNGCKDKTSEVVREFKSNKLKILEFEQSGKGFAITEGFREALKGNAELIGFVDADMATMPFAFYNLLESIKNYDGVIASRYIKGAKVLPKQPLMRRLVSRVGNFIIRSLFFLPYRDTQCGAKIFKREVVERIVPKLETTQWVFDIELLHKIRKEGFYIREVPTFWRDVERSTLNLKKASIQVFLALIRLRILNSPLKRSWWFFAPFAGGLWKLVK